MATKRLFDQKRAQKKGEREQQRNKKKNIIITINKNNK